MKKILKIFAVVVMAAMPLALMAEDKPLEPGASVQDLKPKAPKSKSKAQQILDQVKQNMDSLDDYQVTIEENSVVYVHKRDVGDVA